MEMVTGNVESPDPQGPSTKLFVGGLPPGVTDEDLRQHFETFGKVDEAVKKQPQGTSLQSHFGFLWVRPAEAARQIIAQDHTIHCASGLSVTIPAPVLARSTPMSTSWHCLQPACLPEGSSQPESRYGLLPRRRTASANQPLGPRWPALHACFFDSSGIPSAPAPTSERPCGLALQVRSTLYPPSPLGAPIQV